MNQLTIRDFQIFQFVGLKVHLLEICLRINEQKPIVNDSKLTNAKLDFI